MKLPHKVLIIKPILAPFIIIFLCDISQHHIIFTVVLQIYSVSIDYIWIFLQCWYFTSFVCVLVTQSCPTQTPWTIARQAPLSMGLLRQEYWSGLPFPSPGDHPDPGFEPAFPVLAGRFFTTEPPGKSENESHSVVSDSLRLHGL